MKTACCCAEMIIADDNQANHQQNDIDEDSEGRCHRWFDVICGIPSAHARSRTRPEITEEQRLEFLYEKPKWVKILNINAAIGMTVMAFLTGFYR